MVGYFNILLYPHRFDPEDIRKFKSVPTGNKKFSADYDWNDQDPTVPEGWKSAIITMNSFGKMVESVRFLSPDGRFCTSRVEAIKYLLKDGGANHDDLMRMQVETALDKFQSNPALVDGFAARRLGDGREPAPGLVHEAR